MEFWHWCHCAVCGVCLCICVCVCLCVEVRYPHEVLALVPLILSVVSVCMSLCLCISLCVEVKYPRGVLALVPLVLSVVYLSVSVYLSVCLSVCRSQVSTWSSGTGAAGVAGSLSYAGLTAIKVSPRTTLLIMLVVPCLLFLTSVYSAHISAVSNEI